MAGVSLERSQNPISFLIHPGLMTAPGFSASQAGPNPAASLWFQGSL